MAKRSNRGWIIGLLVLAALAAGALFVSDDLYNAFKSLHG